MAKNKNINKNNILPITTPASETFDESKDFLEGIFKDLDGTADEFGVMAIMNALVLPEKEFALLSEYILNEQEKALHNVEDKMAMIQALNVSGAKAEDLVSMFTSITERLDTELAGKISQQKIDFLKRFFGMIVDAINSTEGIAKRVVPVPFSFCRAGAQKPKYAKAGDAGMDIYACDTYTIQPGELVIIPTGIQTGIPLGYELQVRPRSGQSVKTKLRIANAPGTIDANFRDEIGIIVENIEPKITDIEFEELFTPEGKFDGLKVKSVLYGKDYVIEKGQRFAQIVISEVPMALLYEVDDIKTIEGDRASGFGGSGKF